ncbi:MAG TPA: beta-ketoacyl synthase N-terminal-like domain-containing protein [Streptosporangiaceae bacterium]
MSAAEWSIPDHATGRRTPVSSLVEVARFRAGSTPRETAFVLHQPGEDGEKKLYLSYEGIDTGSRQVAAGLHNTWQSPKGRKAILLYPPPSVGYITAFLGCMYAGVLPVPVYPPLSHDQWAGLTGIIRNCGAELICTCSAMASLASGFLAGSGMTGIGVLDTDQLTEPLAEPAIHFPGADDIAFLQYTSGSTGQPKGVMVRQRNLLANLAAISSAFGVNAGARGVVWLPPYHDMGLIGGILTPLHQGFITHLSSPVSFLTDPLSWLRRISDIRATISPAPDFAYALCARKARGADLADLDLSCWTRALTGAETVRKQTLESFTETFAPAGFRRSAFCSCYGLAESTLLVTSTARDREPAVAPESQAVTSGQPRGSEVLIVVPGERRVAGEGEQGEIWVSGPSVTAGYWGDGALADPGEQAGDTFGGYLADGSGPYLRTGDLGYWAGGEMVVLGRIKDLIIVRGRNIAPASVEDAAWRSSPLLRPGCVAAFALEGPQGEEAAIVAEARSASASRQQLAQAAQQLRVAVAASCGVSLSLAVIVAPGAVPKTSSGKVGRSSCRDLLHSGALPVLHSADFPRRDRSHDIYEKENENQALDQPVGPRAGSAADTIAGAAAEVLAVPAAGLDRDRVWTELGLDSVGVVEVAALAQQRLGRDIPARLLFDHPTISALAAEMKRRATAAAAPAPAGPVPAVPSDPSEPVAIVGMACRFPGAEDAGAFWELVRDGGSALGQIPSGRKELAGCEDGGQPIGALAGADRFDAKLLGVHAPEARAMDPQHRLLLETAWAALEESGVDPRSLGGSQTGVYVGISSADYSQISGRGRVSPYTGIGVSPAAAAGRISYHLGLRGPSLAVDTACSSSLTATHLAVQALRRGECGMAVVGGVNLVLTAPATAALDRLGVLSLTGQSLPFDAGADGYLRGEGCGVIVLVLLSQARRQRMPVRAMIRGSAASHNGAGNGFTAPSGAAQREVIGLALRDAGLDPSRIGYLEAHGSATPIGDEIELAAAAQALGGQRPDDSPLRIGSVKANIGHLEAAAGIAGLIKAVLALEHAEFPALPLPTGPTAAIDWERARLTAPARAAPWPSGGLARAAGVSSFGFSGTNVHVVLEEAPRAAPAAQPAAGPGTLPQDRRVIVPVSALTQSALQAAVARLAGALRAAAPDLAAVAGTLAEHRAQFGCRAAFHATSVSELTDKLDKWLTMPPCSVSAAPPDVTVIMRAPATAAAAGKLSPRAAVAALRSWGVPVRADEEALDQQAAAEIRFSGSAELGPASLADIESLFDAACAYYVLGGDLDLHAVNGPPPHLVRLPSYPFEGLSYWVSGSLGDRHSEGNHPRADSRADRYLVFAAD